MENKILNSASAMIFDKEGRVLIARRSKNRRLDSGLWEIIGGGLEFSEHPIECIKREVKDELCVEFVEPKLFDVYSFAHKDFHLISVVYSGRIEGKIKIQTDEIDKVEWIKVDDIPKYEFSINCRERIKDYFAKKKLGSEITMF